MACKMVIQGIATTMDIQHLISSRYYITFRTKKNETLKIFPQREMSINPKYDIHFSFITFQDSKYFYNHKYYQCNLYISTVFRWIIVF